MLDQELGNSRSQDLEYTPANRSWSKQESSTPSGHVQQHLELGQMQVDSVLWDRDSGTLCTGADVGSPCNQLLHLIAGRHQSGKLAVSRLEVLIEM